MSFTRNILKKFIALTSWRTHKKLLVIESDDWGTERTFNKESLNGLLKLDAAYANDPFTCYDSIASQDDLSHLFEVLTSLKDSSGNHPVLTANVCMANPDFEKIQESNFQQFYYEPFFETVKNRDRGDDILKLWREGQMSGVFIPQLHGREHVHALAWLSELRANNSSLVSAFYLRSWGVPYKAQTIQRRKNLMASLDVYGLEGEYDFQNQWILDSAALFKSFFGYSSKTFIPPAYTWHSRIIPALKEAGVRGIQGIRFQYEPSGSNKSLYKKKLHLNGYKKREGIARLNRNAAFEPATDKNLDWLDVCLSGIDFAFRNSQPAIISSHRVNFIGVLSPENRDKNLFLFSELLKAILQRWPDVQFVSSAQLVEQMMEK